MKICGRKTITPPTPAITPSTIRLRNGPSAIDPSTSPASQPTPGVDQVHRRHGPGEDRLEDQGHQHDEDDRAEEPMRQDAVDPVAGAGPALVGAA